MRRLTQQTGYTLIELIVVLIIIGIVAAVSINSLQSANDAARYEQTKQELDRLAKGIAGDPELVSGGMRTDYGYVGDVGALPPNLNALVSNPGLGSWNGPYIRDELTLGGADSDYLYDAWGRSYTYAGGNTIASSGNGGTTLTRRLAASAQDLLYNRVALTVSDLDGSPPGALNRDSVEVVLSYPNGSGGTATRSQTPAANGYAEFDSVPIGIHLARMVYLPTGDTLRREINVGPGQDYYSEIQYFDNVWTSADMVAGCGAGGTLVLRPVANGGSIQLTRHGTGSQNWECVSEEVADGSASYVERASLFWGQDYYQITDTSLSCPITAVRVCANAAKDNNHGYIGLDVYTHAVAHSGGDQSLSTSWADYSQEWTVNPATGSDWTWSEIQNLQVRLRLRGELFLWPAYCTQVWVEVDYGP